MQVVVVAAVVEAVAAAAAAAATTFFPRPKSTLARNAKDRSSSHEPSLMRSSGLAQSSDCVRQMPSAMARGSSLCQAFTAFMLRSGE
jgi:hypothetical protein